MPPATALVACGGEQHRVSWRRGKLKLEDHDLAAERTMLAFGGETPACLHVLQLWRNLHSWAMSTELLRQMQSRLGPDVLLAPGDLARVHRLGLLLTWERAWRRSAYFSDHGRLLDEELRESALPPLRQHLRWWMERRGCRRIASLELRVLRGGQEPGLRGEMDAVSARATAGLGAGWLVGVWARGLAVVDGAFVLEVTDDEAGQGGVVVRAVRWEGQPSGRASAVTAEAVVEPGPDGGWRLHWREGAVG
ncbi:MAG: hypothetical protein M3Q48_13020 [Actinomycetota bacterium]|nr:hypothetical protein [Actinomycetota bacterium]